MPAGGYLSIKNKNCIKVHDDFAIVDFLHKKELSGCSNLPEAWIDSDEIFIYL